MDGIPEAFATGGYGQLVNARGVVGLGEAGYGSVGAVLIASHFPSRMRGALMAAFLACGYTRQHALEVVLGIGTYTMSTLANRLTDAPLDDRLSAFAWHTAAA